MMILRNRKRLITGDQEQSTVKKMKKIDQEENKKGRVVLNNRNKVDPDQNKERVIVSKRKKINQEEDKKEKRTVKKRIQIDDEKQNKKGTLIVKKRHKRDQKENNKERAVVKKRKHIDAEEKSKKERLIVKKVWKIDPELINNERAIVCKDLPEELVIGNVLTRLSARTLAVCSCVCKLWYNTIYKDERFATSHFVQNQNKLSLFFNLLNLQRINIKKSFILNLEEKEKGALDLKNLAVINSGYRIEIVGYCNGLVCFGPLREDLTSGTKGAVFVVNPARGETLFLSYLIPPGEYIHLCHGFGFDSSSQEYKIVVIFASKANDEFVSKVITLGSRSWRKITTAAAEISLPRGFPIPGKIVTEVSPLSASGTLCGGDLFWKIKNEVFEEDVIADNIFLSFNKIQMLLSFDLHNEKIKFIGLPTESSRTSPENENPFFTVDHLLEFKGYPCVARFEKIVTSDNDHRCKYPSRCSCCCKVHLYILKDKLEQAWIKGESFDIQIEKEGLPASRFGCYFETTPPRILSCSNQVLLYWFDGDCLVLYNLQTKYVQVVKGSRSCPRVFPKLNDSLSLGYEDSTYSRSVENQLHAQVENMCSLKAFIPEGETIQSNSRADFMQLVGNKLPAGWLMTERPSVNYCTFF